MWFNAALLALLLAAGVLGLQATGIELDTLRPSHIHAYVTGFGATAPLVYILFYSQPLIPFPVSLLTVAGGLLFGPVFGSLLAWIGALVRASGQFALARRLGRGAVERLVRGRLAAWECRVSERGLSTVLLVRIVPNFPYDIQNFGLGLSTVRWKDFLMGTAVGILPSQIGFALIGSALVAPGQLWYVIAGMVAALAGVGWLARRFDRASRQANKQP